MFKLTLIDGRGRRVWKLHCRCLGRVGRLASAVGPANACPNPVVLPDNAFKNRQLYATPYYAAKVAASVKNIADPDLARRAAMIGDVGTFMWMFV
ncbi:hypothetical protein E4T49_01951 [Aureobasidium sp. EXF-10728]|nr:hypothetical protein E4T49_01951 [Aureobasidium sp. EXF-10728]